MFIIPSELLPGDTFDNGETVMERLPNNPRTNNPVFIVREFLGWQTKRVEFCSPTVRVNVRRTGTTY